MEPDQASSQNPSPFTSDPPAEAMELGFQAALGPLSQISVQLFSAETAVHIATGALKGWWKARDRAESLQSVLKAADTGLAPIAAFDAKRYSDIRNRYPVHGVARQEGGVLTSLKLPAASNSKYGKETGLWCLYAMITALQCIFDVDATSKILIDVLPTILHYGQEERQISDDGPLFPAVKAMVAEVVKEEKTTKATEMLLKHIEEQFVSTCASSLHQINIEDAVDSKLITAFLLWLSIPFHKRAAKHQHPTRSFIVWAIAEILQQLGFDLHVSKDPITTEEQYRSVFETVHNHEREVYFVPAAVGRTDPDLPSGTNIAVTPHVRVVPIRAIPTTERRQHFPLDASRLEDMSKAWEFTFNHVQKYLRLQPHIQTMIGRGKHIDQNATEIKPSQPGQQTTLTGHKLKGFMLLSRGHSRSSPESLGEMLYKPIERYIGSQCADCAHDVHQDFTEEWCWTDDVDDEAIKAPSEAVVSRQEHNQGQKLMMKAILMAAGYTIACLFIKDGNEDASIDTQVAYIPSLFGNVSDCFSLDLKQREWIYKVYSFAAVGKAQKNSTCTENGRVQFTSAILSAVTGLENTQYIGPESFGGYSNGFSAVSSFLLNPADPFAYHSFSLSFGHPIDLPLDENSLISSVENYKDLPACPFSLAAASKVPPDPRPRSPHDRSSHMRWDIEPDWAQSETLVHFRCRIGGISQVALSPLWMMREMKKNRVSPVPCACDAALSLRNYDVNNTWTGQNGVNVVFLSFADIRRSGRFMKVDLNPDAAERTVVVIDAGGNPLEQWLALYTTMEKRAGTRKDLTRRFLGVCLRCGIEVACGDLSVGASTCIFVLSS